MLPKVRANMVCSALYMLNEAVDSNPHSARFSQVDLRYVQRAWEGNEMFC